MLFFIHSVIVLCSSLQLIQVMIVSVGATPSASSVSVSPTTVENASSSKTRGKRHVSSVDVVKLDDLELSPKVIKKNARGVVGG